MKKILILILILLLPAAIFLFLKGFGENEFAVKKYYQNEAPEVSGCLNEYEAPYRINTKTWRDNLSGDFNVIHFASDPDRSSTMRVNISRVYDTFLDEERISMLTIFPMEDSSRRQELVDYLQESIEWDTIKWQIKSLNSAELDSLQQCVYLAGLHEEGRADVVLLDNSNTIRGYYQSDKVLETDTLILELKILLKEE